MIEIGYFKKGVWIDGEPKLPIVNAIVRTNPCLCPGSAYDYYDYSYSIKGKYGDRSPYYEYVIFHGIDENGHMIIEWEPRWHPLQMSKLEPWWNDGNWIEYLGEEE